MERERHFIQEEGVDKDELAQKAYYWRAQWRDRFLSTEPVDRTRIEQSIRYVLRYFHKPYDVPIVWVGSPTTMAVVACAASILHAYKQYDTIELIHAYIFKNMFHRSILHSIESELFRYWENKIDQRIMKWSYHAITGLLRHVFQGIQSTLASSVNDSIVSSTIRSYHDDLRHDRFRSIDETLYTAYGAIVNHAIDCAIGRTPSREEKDSPAETIPLDDAALIATDAAMQRIAYTQEQKRGYLSNLAQWRTLDYNTTFAFSTHYSIEPAYHTFFPYAFEFQAPKLLQVYCDLLSTGGISFTDAFVIVCERPAILKTENRADGSLRFHATDGPAIAWRDGAALWYINGVRVPRVIVEAPETITADQILHEGNIELRRIMLDRMGVERFLREVKVTVRHEDTDQYGFPRRLLVANMRDVEPMCAVEVVNATPEPIGYTPKEGENGLWVGNRWHKKYLLRVPPSCQTTQEAVAWTFGINAEEYRPDVET